MLVYQRVITQFKRFYKYVEITAGPGRSLGFSPFELPNVSWNDADAHGWWTNGAAQQTAPSSRLAMASFPAMACLRFALGSHRATGLRRPGGLGKEVWTGADAIGVCLKIGYIPNYSHLVGIMIINQWV